MDVEVEAEVVEEEEEKEEEGGGRRRTTLIKSNNPHLAGGEKCGRPNKPNPVSSHWMSFYIIRVW